MLNPSVQVTLLGGLFVAEFWDCLRLDPAPVQTLRARFDDHLRGGGRPDLVVDLLGVAYAGSAALGGFVALQRVGRQKGGRMVFCNVDPTVFEVFRVSRLDNLFTFSADRQTAIDGLADAGPGLESPPAPSGPRPSPEPPRSPRVGGASPLRRKPKVD